MTSAYSFLYGKGTRAVLEMNCITIDALSRKTIKNFLDILILKYLKRQPLANGYDIIKQMYKDFGILISPGTIYSAVYSLERQALIKGNSDKSGRTYSLTRQGAEMLNHTYKTKEQIQFLISKIFSETQN